MTYDAIYSLVGDQFVNRCAASSVATEAKARAALRKVAKQHAKLLHVVITREDGAVVTDSRKDGAAWLFA